jgi:hypothetical protein
MFGKRRIDGTFTNIKSNDVFDIVEDIFNTISIYLLLFLDLLKTNN